MYKRQVTHANTPVTLDLGNRSVRADNKGDSLISQAIKASAELINQFRGKKLSVLLVLLVGNVKCIYHFVPNCPILARYRIFRFVKANSRNFLVT